MDGSEANTNSNDTKEKNMKFTIKMWDGSGFSNTAQFNSKTPTARQILDDFGYVPPDEHILLHVPEGGKLEEIALDSEFKLERSEDAKFVAFRADRSFKLSLNERRMTWGDNEISVATLRALSGADDDQEFVLGWKVTLKNGSHRRHRSTLQTRFCLIPNICNRE